MVIYFPPPPSTVIYLCGQTTDISRFLYFHWDSVHELFPQHNSLRTYFPQLAFNAPSRKIISISWLRQFTRYLVSTSGDTLVYVWYLMEPRASLADKARGVWRGRVMLLSVAWVMRHVDDVVVSLACSIPAMQLHTFQATVNTHGHYFSKELTRLCSALYWMHSNDFGHA